MSLNDEHPTQYIGPHAVEFTGPHGKPIRVSQEHFNRLTESGALTDEQMLNAKQDGLSLADILAKANAPAEHDRGCSITRTGRCICAYLQQWDTK